MGEEQQISGASGKVAAEAGSCSRAVEAVTDAAAVGHSASTLSQCGRGICRKLAPPLCRQCGRGICRKLFIWCEDITDGS